MLRSTSSKLVAFALATDLAALALLKTEAPLLPSLVLILTALVIGVASWGFAACGR